MPAPRTCRSCGADLAPDIRWCTRCYAPVTEFAARERLHDGYVGAPRTEMRTSRWRAGPLTFGPIGRLLATAIVVLMGPWGSISLFTLLYAPVWIAVAVIVLRQIWRPETIDPDEPPTRSQRFRERHPFLGRPIGGRAFTSGAIALSMAAWVTGIVVMDTAGRVILVAVAAIIGVGLLIAWLAEV